MTATVRIAVCRAAELPVGASTIVEYGGRSIGIYNVRGELYALRNICPHRGAPLCQGRVSGTMLPSEPDQLIYDLDGEIVRCPWHGWEFEIKSGLSFLEPEKYRVKTYSVEKRDGTVFLVM